MKRILMLGLLLVSCIGFTQNVSSFENCSPILIVPPGVNSVLDTTLSGEVAMDTLLSNINTYEIRLMGQITFPESLEKAHVHIGTTFGASDILNEIYLSSDPNNGMEYQLYGSYLSLSLGEHTFVDSLFYEIFLENNQGDSSIVQQGIIKE